MTFYLKTGDRLPALRVKVVSKETGQVKDLTSAGVKFSMVDEIGTVVIDGEDGVTEDGSNRLIKYAWAEGDTDHTGNHDGEFVINDGTANKFRVPGQDSIRVAIGEAL